VLRPLMIVAGDHANNDMAGDDKDSWKSVFEAAGYEVVCVVEGLGQLEAIQELILAHAADAILNQVK
jgi:sirohydrochlorin cobaltochelatase